MWGFWLVNFLWMKNLEEKRVNFQILVYRFAINQKWCALSARDALVNERDVCLRQVMYDPTGQVKEETLRVSNKYYKNRQIRRIWTTTRPKGEHHLPKANITRRRRASLAIGKLHFAVYRNDKLQFVSLAESLFLLFGVLSTRIFCDIMKTTGIVWFSCQNSRQKTNSPQFLRKNIVV